MDRVGNYCSYRLNMQDTAGICCWLRTATLEL
jgi:hypothetical protein